MPTTPNTSPGATRRWCPAGNIDLAARATPLGTSEAMTAATTTPRPAKHDPITDRFFKPLEILEHCSGWLFYVVAVVSFLPLFIEKTNQPVTFEAVQIVFVVLVLALFAAGLAARLWLMPAAHDARRLDLLSHAYNVPLTHEQTEGYYNNDQTDPIRRLGASTMENALFTREILRSMARWERVKTAAYLIAFLAALMYKGYPPEVWGIAAQAVFSEQIVSRLLRLEWLRQRADRVYSDLYVLFQTRPTKLDVHSRSLGGFALYETSKENAAITLSARIFHAKNPSLSKDWDAVRERLGL